MISLEIEKCELLDGNLAQNDIKTVQELIVLDGN